MNRREFLKGLIATGILAATTDIEKILINTERLADEEFITYINWTMRLIVVNPAYCARIDNIEE